MSSKWKTVKEKDRYGIGKLTNKTFLYCIVTFCMISKLNALSKYFNIFIQIY